MTLNKIESMKRMKIGTDSLLNNYKYISRTSGNYLSNDFNLIKKISKLVKDLNPIIRIRKDYISYDFKIDFNVGYISLMLIIYDDFSYSIRYFYTK